MMKILLIILDGVGDRPCDMLKGKTPLEAANKPNIDFLAKNGKLYLMDVINKNIAPESDQGTLALFGYDVAKVFTGRGPLEAYGDNINFEKGNIVVRCNFASLKKDKIHHNRINDIESMPTDEEVRKIEDIRIKDLKFKRTIGYRGVLIINKKSSPRVTNSHPGYNIMSIKNFLTTALPVKNHMLIQKKVKAMEPKAEITARLINEFIDAAKKILKNKTILTRGAGNRLPKLHKMSDWTIMADMPVEKAIGKLAKMKIVKKPDDLTEASRIIKKEIKKNNVYIQIKKTDSASHKGDAIEKKKTIEDIDRKLISNIKNLENTLIIVTGDHSTPCNLMAHSNDPVPVLVYGIGNGKASTFSEKEARKISNRIEGKNLIKMLMKNTKHFK